MKTWICPGSFDPITVGHLDIIERASKRCEKLIIAVGKNGKKNATFTLEERINMITKSTSMFDNVEVDSYEGLLVSYAKEKNASALIKGLRAVSDFEYEFQMALLNKRLDDSIETLFLMTSINYSHLSSSAVKEIATNNGEIRGLVPDCIYDDICSKLKRRNNDSSK